MSENHKHSERAHAILSCSGSDRWMNCTPSARKEEHIPNVESSYALEGTLAHELAETELKKYFGLINIFEYKNRIREIENNKYYSNDMPEYVDVYVSYCIEQVNYYKSICEHVEISIEDKINLSHYIPDGGGSNDFVIIADNFIVVIDLKYGRGVSVSAIDNSQLKLYGLGSVFKHELSYRMNEVILTIVQPRTHNISTDTILVSDLKHWAETVVVEKAKIAYAGEGELNPGSWCKFCKFKPKCKAIYEQNMKLIKKDFGDPQELTEEEIKEVFEKSDQIISWVNSVNALIMDRLMNKKPFEGYKLVKGRSVRQFKSPESVIKKLRNLEYNDEDFMSEPKLLGITAIEKLVGKKNFEKDFGNLYEKSEPKPSIAPISDTRESFFSSVEDDFGASVDSINDTKSTFENDSL